MADQAEPDQPGDSALARSVTAAVDLLAAGEVVGLPTDTVYGLAADVYSADGVRRIFELKQRPPSIQLPVLVSDASQASELVAGLPPTARVLIDAFWPGPLTLVLPRKPGLASFVGEATGTIAVRCANHPVPMSICGRLGPVATTSANLHGRPPLQSASELEAAFAGLVRLVIDGGVCSGPASTVVDCTGPTPVMLRSGALRWDVISAVLSAS